jgi:DNA-binding transcriptional regulator YiaG
LFNWEANTVAPEVRFMPAIIRFLGCNPLPEARALAEQLVRHRTTLGLSQKEAAKGVSVDPSTLARWEQGEREPTGGVLGRVELFLVDNAGRHAAARRVG